MGTKSFLAVSLILVLLIGSVSFDYVFADDDDKEDKKWKKSQNKRNVVTGEGVPQDKKGAVGMLYVDRNTDDLQIYEKTGKKEWTLLGAILGGIDSSIGEAIRDLQNQIDNIQLIQGPAGADGQDGASGADGVPGTTDWTELTNVPAGFADSVDDTSSGPATDVDCTGCVSGTDIDSTKSLTARDFRYDFVQQRTLVLSAMEFDSRTGDGMLRNLNFAALSTVFAPDLVAAVHTIPDGAIITEFKCSVDDGDPTHTVICKLFALDAVTGVASTRSTLITSGEGENQVLTSGPLNSPFNRQSGYAVQVTTDPFDLNCANCRIQSATIHYTVSTVD